jgi:hypothetical protein
LAARREARDIPATESSSAAGSNTDTGESSGPDRRSCRGKPIPCLPGVTVRWRERYLGGVNVRWPFDDRETPQLIAEIPVMSRPTSSAWMWSVPS